MFVNAKKERERESCALSGPIVEFTQKVESPHTLCHGPLQGANKWL